MTESSDEISDRDLAHIETTPTVKASSALHGIAGVVTALSGLQFVTSGSFYEASLNALPWTMVALGVLQVGIALMVLRNHHPAAIAGAIVAPLVAIAALAWLVLSITSGMLSFLAIGGVPAAAAAALLAPFTLRPTARGWAAKKRLQQSGIELGL